MDPSGEITCKQWRKGRLRAAVLEQRNLLRTCVCESVCEGSQDSPEHYQSQRSHSENGHTQPAWGNDLWGMSTLKEQESGGEMDEDRVTEQG